MLQARPWSWLPPKVSWTTAPVQDQSVWPLKGLAAG